MGELVSWASYHCYDVEIIEEVQEVFGEMVGYLAYEHFTGTEHADKFNPIKDKFNGLVEKYGIEEEDSFEELKSILVRKYKSFADSILSQHKNDNLEENALDKAFSNLKF